MGSVLDIKHGSGRIALISPVRAARTFLEKKILGI